MEKRPGRRSYSATSFIDSAAKCVGWFSKERYVIKLLSKCILAIIRKVHNLLARHSRSARHSPRIRLLDRRTQNLLQHFPIIVHYTPHLVVREIASLKSAMLSAFIKHKSAYLMAVGGSGYLVSKAIKATEVVAFADLGMEAIYEFTVQDMPVTVAVDSTGESVHKTGPREWQARIGKIPVVVE